MSAKTFYGYYSVACYIVNSALYLSHSLGGSTENDQTINKLGFSQSHVVVVIQSNACLHSLLSYAGVSKPGANPSFKNAKTYSEIYPWDNRPISG